MANELDASKRPVLVVDDSDDLREILVELVSEQGFPVAAARDGGDALRMLANVHPAIVLLDMNMPEMDGLEFLERLPSVPGVQRPVVIAMSADRNFASIAKEKGALDFLQKPFDSSVLALALVEASAGRIMSPELRARHLEHIRQRHVDDDARRDEILRSSRIGAPELRHQLASMLRWLCGYFDIPMSLVNLLRNGHLELFENYGTPRGYRAGAVMSAEDTYCADLTRNSESLVLHDGSGHPVYREHPLTKLGVRFYASVPIRTPPGLSLGTLCLESTGPVDRSTFRTEDLLLLRYFADTIGGHVIKSVTDPAAPSSVFPDPNLLERDAFRAALASRVAPSSSDAFPVTIVKLEGANADFVREAGRVFDGLASRRRLAIARHDLPNVVAGLGSTEGLAGFTSALESRGLAFVRSSKTIASPIPDATLTDLFGAASP